MHTATAGSSADVVFWGLVLVVGIAVLGMMIFALRRWLFTERKPGDDVVWTMQYLREMRGQGQITEQEFERLRTQMLGAHGADGQRKDGMPGAASRSFDAAGKQIKEGTDPSR